MTDLVKEVFNFLDTLTILDASCMVVIYITFAFLMINICMRFKFLNVAEYFHVSVVSCVLSSCIFLYFTDRHTASNFISNIFVKSTITCNLILLAFYAVYEILKWLKEKKMIKKLDDYNKIQNIDNQETNNQNTNNGEKNNKTTDAIKQNSNKEGTYSDYDYYYKDNIDKYAEPFTTKPYINSNDEIKKEITRLSENVNKISQVIDGEKYSNNNDEEIKSLKEQIQSLVNKMQIIESRVNKNEELDNLKLENLSKKETEINTNNNKNIIYEEKKDVINSEQDMAQQQNYSNTNENSDINENIWQMIKENNDSDITQKEKQDAVQEELSGQTPYPEEQDNNVFDLKNKLRILKEQRNTRNDVLEEKSAKINQFNEEMNDIINQTKKQAEYANSFGTKFGNKLAAQLEKLTNTLETKQQLAEQQEKQELLKQKNNEDIQRDKEIKELENEINNLENNYVSPMQIDNKENPKKSLQEEIDLNSISIDSDGKDQPTKQDTNVGTLVAKTDKNTEITTEKTFDIALFEDSVMDKVKTMLTENNDLIDEKMSLIRTDMNNLKDGIQGVVDRMTQLFELLTITLQNNKNHTL